MHTPLSETCEHGNDGTGELLQNAVKYNVVFLKLQQQLMLILIAAIQTRQIQNNDIADLIRANGGQAFSDIPGDLYCSPE